MGGKIPTEFFSIEHYALQVREETTRDFDGKNKAEIELTLSQMRKLLVIKLMAMAESGVNSEARFEAYSINKQVLDILVSALQMARQRGAIEVLTLLRVALEASCTALQISRNEEALRRYIAGKYKSTNAVTFAKTLLPIVGEIYGALSQAAIHINQVAYGPRIEEVEGDNLGRSISLDFTIRDGGPIQDSLLLSSISLVALIALKMYELALFDEDDSLKGWFKLSGTSVRYLSNSEELISKYLEEIKAAPGMRTNG